MALDLVAGNKKLELDKERCEENEGIFCFNRNYQMVRCECPSDRIGTYCDQLSLLERALISKENIKESLWESVFLDFGSLPAWLLFVDISVGEGEITLPKSPIIGTSSMK